MSNTILTHYAKKLELAKKADKFLAEIIQESGFAPEKEIWRGLILGDNKKAGSVIYIGKYKGGPAILKIQHLKPVVNEPEIIRLFYKNSKSQKVFVPRVFFEGPWGKKRGYGYFISELILGRRILGRQEFCRFYEEYKTKIKIRPGWWAMKAEERDVVTFNLKRLESWLKIVQTSKMLKPSFYQPKIELYKKILKKYGSHQPMEFMHGHLSPHDIIKTPSGKYYLMSNFLWSYRPQWYDLAFNLWVHINDLPEISYNELDDYIENWLVAYKSTKMVRKDKYFERYFWLNLLERALGSILVDFGSVKYPAEKRKMVRVNFERWKYIFNKAGEKAQF